VPDGPPTIALLGLGEAGGRFARDLRDAGVPVRGWDPLPQTGPDAASAAAAADGADVVLSANSAADAADAARSVLDVLRPGQAFADLNTGSPELKAELARIVAPTGAGFADVALMAPVPGKGIGTPTLASGPGAARFAELLGPLGMPVELVGDAPGAAAERKLLRSIVWKGLAAVFLEATAAGEAAGKADAVRAEILGILAEADEALVERMLTGSRTHATRRTHEMEAVGQMLRDLGVPSWMSDGSAEWLRTLRVRGDASQGDASPGPGDSGRA
jgi:3-hydroxyisobutyrate dehydrogenase-like beta-hydroxyacid dehydrogenase